MIFTPEPYQEQMSEHLLTHQQAALFVGMGLGKTSATLSALNHEFQDGAIRSALVVAPLRVANLTWPNEIKKWDQFKWMRVQSLRSKRTREAEIYTVNYESLHKVTDLSRFDTIIFDELTKAKSHQSKRINALRRLLEPTGLDRWGLTGTPRPNSLLELFAQVRLLDNGARFGRSFDTFKRAYFHPIDYMEYDWRPNPGAEETIYGKIADLALTLRSSDYLDIADTIVEDVEVALPESAVAAYKKLEKDLLLRFETGDVTAQNAAVLVGKLLQITGGSVYDEHRNTVPLHDAKLEMLGRIVARHPGESVMIACNFIHERERICAAYGYTDASKFKGDIEDAWNSKHITHLVADPRSLGHGLNLQGGGRVIVWYSPKYSRELYDQFNARLARKGQAEVPLVYRILCPNTIDDAVIETLRTRGNEQAQMLSILTNLQQLNTAG